MSILLVRPYPVRLLAGAREAITRAAAGDVRPLMALYHEAVRALEAMDPDEVAELRDGWEGAPTSDRVAARAALAVADTWEGIVVVGATITQPARFRGFALLAAEARYGEAAPALERMSAYSKGASLPDVSPEDSALYAALPAMVGLGPEHPEELPGPVPLEGEPVHRLLGLPDADWSGIDPLDGLAVPSEVCLARLAGLPPAWRALVSRCADQGLLIRPS